VIAASIPGILLKAVVYFWAAGPQLAICLWLAYATCRRRRGRMLEWLVGGFAAALLPVAGVVVMIVLYRRAGRGRAQARGGAAGTSDGAAGTSDRQPDAGRDAPAADAAASQAADAAAR
jgi:hypothetical protein